MPPYRICTVPSSRARIRASMMKHPEAERWLDLTREYDRQADYLEATQANARRPYRAPGHLVGGPVMPQGILA